MAQKRMFTMKIVDSDAFLEMPLSTQCLYFHLNMRADDDGFIGNPRKIMRMIGAGEDDMKLLLAKKFLIIFENNIVVIKHWWMHNTLIKDRYHETAYTDEKRQLKLKDNNSYTLDNDGVPLVNVNADVNEMLTECITNRQQNVNRNLGLNLDLNLDKDLDLNLINIPEKNPNEENKNIGQCPGQIGGQCPPQCLKKVHGQCPLDIRDKRLYNNIITSYNIINTPQKNKKTKKTTQPKKKYTENKNVALTDSEYNKLVEEFGEDQTLQILNNFSEIKLMHNYKYASDYMALKNWGIKSYFKKLADDNDMQNKNKIKYQNNNMPSNFEDRDF